MAISRQDMTQSVDGKVTREPKDSATGGKFYWWKQKDDPTRMALEIASTIKHIQAYQESRTEDLSNWTRLYGNSSVFHPFGVSAGRSFGASGGERINFNLCSSVVDTLVSKMAKNKVVPMFITSGGTWGMQRKAENLSKFLDGAFYEQKVHEKAIHAFRDGAVWGDGLVYVYRDHKDRAAVERVLPHEIIVDQFECLVGQPRQLHRVKIVDRGVLMDMFQDDEDALKAIESVEPAQSDKIGGMQTAADLVTVTASWHLKSGEDAGDGVYALCVGDQPLEVSEWDKDYFPFPHFQYVKRLLGFWGQGACERLKGLQSEVNRLMILVQKSMWMNGSFKVLIENGSKVVSQHLNNDVGSIIHYTGTPPQYVTPPMVQQDIYPYIDSLIAKGFQQEGVSQLAASSMKPQGIDSGAALRTYDQIADDRQLFIGQMMEEVHLEIGRQMIEVVKDVHKEKGAYQVKFPNTNFLETIDWNDVNLEKDEYTLKAFPTSSLPDEPMAKLSTVQEYAQAGWISPRAARRLMAMPDVEMSDKLANAAENLIHKVIEDILYDEKDDSRPDGNWDLQLAKQISLEWYNYALLNNCPDERMQMLRDFMSYIDDEMGLTAQAQPGPEVGSGAPDQGQGSAPASPMPPPQSNLIPNVNS